jgi:Ca-dependent carbohydrate-binding module xylan-binding
MIASVTTTGLIMAISTPTKITVNASGSPAGNVFPHFRVLVDGAIVGEATVNSYTKAYSFNANITADQAHLIKIHYNNDGSINGQDRNLFVSSIKVGDVAMAPTEVSSTIGSHWIIWTSLPARNRCGGGDR